MADVILLSSRHQLLVQNRRMGSRFGPLSAMSHPQSRQGAEQQLPCLPRLIDLIATFFLFPVKTVDLNIQDQVP